MQILVSDSVGTLDSILPVIPPASPAMLLYTRNYKILGDTIPFSKLTPKVGVEHISFRKNLTPIRGFKGTRLVNIDRIRWRLLN